MRVNLDERIPQHRKDRTAAHAERLVKMMIGKTPTQAKAFVASKVQDGTITRDEVLLGLVGAMAYMVNCEDNND